MKISIIQGGGSNHIKLENRRVRVAFDTTEMNHIFGQDMPPKWARVTVIRSPDNATLRFTFGREGRFGVAPQTKSKGIYGPRHTGHFSFSAREFRFPLEKVGPIICNPTFPKKNVITTKVPLKLQDEGTFDFKSLEFDPVKEGDMFRKALRSTYDPVKEYDDYPKEEPEQHIPDPTESGPQKDAIEELRAAIQCLNEALEHPDIKGARVVQQPMTGKVIAIVEQTIS